MTETLSASQLSQIAMHALEATAFMIVDPVGELGNEPFEYNSMINIQGAEHDIWLVLSASGGFLEELASSMLGLDPSEVDQEVEGPQALSELANILGGEVVMALGGAELSFNLSLPQSPVSDERLAHSQTTCELDSMGERCRISIA
ncbi:MAG: hypothetical protein ACI841_003445 [Planctomycetota bacterium]|jgi:hypothetical protein